MLSTGPEGNQQRQVPRQAPPRSCKLLRFNPRPKRVERPADSLATAVARLILARWAYPATNQNLDAVEAAFRLPIAQLQQLSSTLPRSWICSKGEPQIGGRITEA